MTESLPQSAFGDLATLLVIAATVGFIGVNFRQPLVVSFIAVGLLVGPSAFDLVHLNGTVKLLSELGVAVLLFLVGIKLDIHLIRSLGPVALLTGFGQIAFTAIFGLFLCMSLGLDLVTSSYVAVALTFSSTIIIVKLLSDRREIESLHGQIALGLLIVQDLVVVFAMIALSAIGIGSQGGAGNILLVLVSGVALVGLVALFIRYAADPLTERLAHAPELLVVFSIAMAAIFAAIGDFVGLGKEVGGLLAGVALASTAYRETVVARLAPLRDFLLLFFFITLGAGLNISLLESNLPAAALLSAFVLAGKPLIMMVIMGVMGYRKRTSFLAGITVAQISEFSLLFVAMGIPLKHINADTLGLVTLVGLITIAVSTYMITYSHELYRLFEPVLTVFERKNTFREPDDETGGATDRYQILIFGLGRFGTALGLRLQKKGIRVLGIDFSPAAVRRWRKLGLDAEHGDAADPNFVEHLPLDSAGWIISTIAFNPSGVVHEDTRTTLLQIARRAGFHGKIAVTSHSRRETDRLRNSGADLVFEPFHDAADRAVEILTLDELADHSITPLAR